MCCNKPLFNYWCFILTMWWHSLNEMRRQNFLMNNLYSATKLYPEYPNINFYLICCITSAGFNKGDTTYKYVQICVVFVCLLSSLLIVRNAAIYSPRGDISISCFNMLCLLPVLAHSSRDIWSMKSWMSSKVRFYWLFFNPQVSQ